MQLPVITPSRGRATVYASDYLLLDSSVDVGGGTNQTALFQAILDKAVEWGRLHLILDGAALVDGLYVHSHTTIECPDKSCGLFLDDNRNEPVIGNAHRSLSAPQRDEDICLLGGTYNQNCRNQVHHTKEQWVYGMQWHGVKDLLLRDVRLRDQATFGICIGNFTGVTLENIHIDVPHLGFLRNQDGIHCWGPGQYLTMRNIRGVSGDDFIALAPDEMDGHSSITDVLIDGVYLEEADQAIRMLSQSTGRLDRVTVRNVSGTYKSYGFFLDPWFYGTEREGGSFGRITVENVDLRQAAVKYTHYTPFLFRLGGNFEVLTLRDIYCHRPADGRPVIEVTEPFHEPHPDSTMAEYVSDIGLLQIDGLTVYEEGDSVSADRYIYINGKVDTLSLNRVRVIRPDGRQGGALLAYGPLAQVGTLEADSSTAALLESTQHTDENGHTVKWSLI